MDAAPDQHGQIEGNARAGHGDRQPAGYPQHLAPGPEELGPVADDQSALIVLITTAPVGAGSPAITIVNPLLQSRVNPLPQGPC